MISVEAARERILAGLSPNSAEIVPLAEAWGRVTAAPVLARLVQPPHDMSAMDGYALQAASGPCGASLPVVGSAPAGHPWQGTLPRGAALRLFTGSVMPSGADCVVLQEDVERDGDTILLTEAAQAGRHIRRAGQDFALDEMLIAAGQRIGARQVGLAAAGNHPWLAVHRRPRVAILATGDEIALPGEPIPVGGIVSSNAHALAALVRACGGTAMMLPVAGDDRIALAAGAKAARGCDLLVTTGGASVGDYDLVREVLREQGMALDFWKIAMRPGKPLLHGHMHGLPVIGLPGNPVSALITAILFLIPAIERLGGLPGNPPTSEPARLGAALPANDGRADYLRASLGRTPDGAWLATAFGRQDSSMLRAMAQADCLILRAPSAPPAAPGDIVDVLRLDRLGV
jgi:molybdopterin molybdotransferase